MTKVQTIAEIQRCTDLDAGAAKRIQDRQRARVEGPRDKLAEALAVVRELPALLTAYEATDDHAHALPPRSRRVEVASFSDVGLRRTNNEDRTLAMLEAGLYAVADGMGGYAAGEVAAQLTVATLEACAATWPPLPPPGTAVDDVTVTSRCAQLLAAVAKANATVKHAAEADPKLHGMGTTVVACCLVGDVLIVVHAGDSRLYVSREVQLEGGGDDGQQDGERGRQLYRLTTDHVSVFFEAGVRLSGVTKCVGVFEHAQPDVKIRRLRPGDVVLLCSDGLHGEVPDDVLSEELAADRPLQETADALLATALVNGGRDNVSAVLLRRS